MITLIFLRTGTKQNMTPNVREANPFKQEAGGHFEMVINAGKLYYQLGRLITAMKVNSRILQHNELMATALLKSNRQQQAYEILDAFSDKYQRLLLNPKLRTLKPGTFSLMH